MARTKQIARSVQRGEYAPPMRLGAVPQKHTVINIPTTTAALSHRRPPVPTGPPPSIMRALVVMKNGASVQDYPTMRPGDDDVIVQVAAVALNPIDWKCTHL